MQQSDVDVCSICYGQAGRSFRRLPVKQIMKPFKLV